MADIITVEDAALALRWRPTDVTTHSDALQLYVSAATPIIEELAGPVIVASKTERFDGGGRSVALAHEPNAITSVTVDGAAWTGFVADLGAGLVYADSTGGTFGAGVQNVVVVYTVGYATGPTDPNMPANVKAATIALVVHNWRRMNPQQILPDDAPTVPQGFAIPRATEDWLRPQKRLPGFA